MREREIFCLCSDHLSKEAHVILSENRPTVSTAAVGLMLKAPLSDWIGLAIGLNDPCETFQSPIIQL